METATSAYAQLLSVGLLWISFHCAGMCGPLLMGLDVAGVARGIGPGRGMGNILTYQLGRALIYALFGAIVGLIGAQLSDSFATAGAVFALGFGAVAVGAAVFRWRGRSGAPVKVSGPRPPGKKDPKAVSGGWLVRTVHKLLGERRGFTDNLALGALMAFLPCMITFWAMGLAATTQSPLHGAGVMVLLVLMTTPMLLGVTLLPRLVLRRIGADGKRRAQAILLTISGVWLVMVGMAGLGWVEHVHLNVTLWDEPLTIMLW